MMPLEEAKSRRSAATDQYLFDLAIRELKLIHGARTLGLRAPDGSERSETIQVGPVTLPAWVSLLCGLAVNGSHLGLGRLAHPKQTKPHLPG